MNRLLSVKEVLSVVGISKSGLYKKISSGEFPAPVAIGQRSVRFRQEDVQAWMDALKAKKDIK